VWSILEARKSYWTHRMELLCDVGQVESHFGPFGDSVCVITREVHGLRQNIPLAQKSFWMHSVVVLGDESQVEARFSPFGDSGNLGAR
jgi:hypothetical protein